MGHRTPGPICSMRVGVNWIDLGTSCRTRLNKPGVTDAADLVVNVVAAAGSPLKAKFDREHVYSKAPEAARKRDIDLQIIGDDYSKSSVIRLDNGDYLKELIRLGSNGDKKVSPTAKKVQFFIIRGGAEGFLPADLANKDARDIVEGGETTGNAQSLEFHFDENDLLAVFDAKGNLIRSALLKRPTSITGIWSKKTANAIYDAWDNKGVSIYRNTHPGWIPYLGLVVDDGMKKKGWVDMHKEEETNGCIFIVDENTPAVGTDELNTFEPKLITEVLSSIGKTPDQVKGTIRLGIMHVVDIK